MFCPLCGSLVNFFVCIFFFFKQKTAYEMRISDWSSDVCSSDLQRMRAPGQPAPVQGIERAGYKLVWRDTPNAYDKARMASSKGYDLTHSLGLSIDKDGVAGSTLWNGPAFRADIVNGTTILAVDGVAYHKTPPSAANTAARKRIGHGKRVLERVDS